MEMVKPGAAEKLALMISPPRHLHMNTRPDRKAIPLRRHPLHGCALH
jgi:hypothetical protein